jgi:D-serine deaminase-like pyridoxal phosphate-dependent protein
MGLGRRRFLASVSAGSAAVVTGCAAPSAPPRVDDGGVPCPEPAVFAPPALDQPSPEYFAQLSADLDAAGIGTPVVVVDLDRMEENVDAIVAAISPLRFRIVEKSLPSIDLLRLVVDRAVAAGGGASFLVLHLPLLPALLEAFPEADVIVGKTQLTSAIASCFAALGEDVDRAAVASRVVFLADDADRLAELVELADALGVTLRIAVEIDVGLRRSGLRDPDELRPILGAFLAATASVELAGLFGYDGHVAHVPRGTREAAEAEWIATNERYDAFVRVLREDAFTPLVHADLIFHSGGTTTHPIYARPPRETAVNDVATGGGVLRPGDYPSHFLRDLRGSRDLAPAIFVAAPVLRVYGDDGAPPALPFFTDAQNAAIFAGRQALAVYGGGWASYFTFPEVGPPPFAGGGGGPSWVPNLGLLTAAPDVPIAAGDWIYFHPTSSEVIFQFERVRLVRGGRLLAETLAPYPRRY